MSFDQIAKGRTSYRRGTSPDSRTTVPAFPAKYGFSLLQRVGGAKLGLLRDRPDARVLPTKLSDLRARVANYHSDCVRSHS
jgi:hypothetical protein